jgi:glyoxylase-like metal-dependent hydrolase (beta-lactamase superfamily II)
VSIKLYVLDAGRMKMDKNLMMNQTIAATRSDPNCPNEFIEFPVSAFLIETPNGFILYDTGCHPDAMGENGRWPHAFQERCPYVRDEEYSVPNRLKELGIAPKDIHTVILSHMHNDHAGGVEFFQSSRFIVHRDEFAAAMTAYATHDYMSSYIWKDIDTWIRTKLNWTFIEPFDGDVKLEKGLTILNFGAGHTPGVLGLMLELERTGAIIITSDAIYCKEAYDHFKAPGCLYDLRGWIKTTNRIHYLANDSNAQVWYGHDMSQFKSLKKSKNGYYD